MENILVYQGINDLSPFIGLGNSDIEIHFLYLDLLLFIVHNEKIDRKQKVCKFIIRISPAEQVINDDVLLVFNKYLSIHPDRIEPVLLDLGEKYIGNRYLGHCGCQQWMVDHFNIELPVSVAEKNLKRDHVRLFPHFSHYCGESVLGDRSDHLSVLRTI